MHAVRFAEYGPADVLRYEEVPDPEPGPGEALVRVRACAVNHVDIDMRNGTSRLPIALPHTLGFEIAGEVAAVGEGVSEVAPGDRVSPLFQIHCRECEWCRRGEHMHCENVRMLGVQSPGGYAEYVVAPAWALIHLPDSLSYEDAAAIQTVERRGALKLVKPAVSVVRATGVRMNDEPLFTTVMTFTCVCAAGEPSGLNK